MAVLLGESLGEDCARVLEAEPDMAISAGTVAEALIVADRRNLGEEMGRLINELGFEVVPLTASSARRVAEAYRRWGRGSRTAGLNFGDCFAYELTQTRSCRLLYVGDDFGRTDLVSAL